MIAVFDTDILIDLLNGIEPALKEAEQYVVREISDITWMEVLAGAQTEEERNIRGFLTHFRKVPITSEIAEQAILERRNRRIKLPDAIIIATAVVGGRLLITRNTRDFSRNDKHVRIPYRLPLQ